MDKKNDVTLHRVPSPADERAAALAVTLPPRLLALARHGIDFWIPRGVDTVGGGFHGQLDRQGRPTAPDDKGVIQQARHLFAISTWYERREPLDSHREIAAHTYRLLSERFRDPADDEFRLVIGKEGRVVDPTKLLYAQGFAIFGLSTYGRVFQEAEPVEEALRCFRAIDRRTHDAVHLGYDEAGEPEWMNNGGRKDTNTHIHLLEAFTALLDATGDDLVRARLKELATLVSTRMLQPSGYVHTQFDLDWTPIKSPVISYGHDIETAWLLLDAEQALGESDPVVEEAAKRMGTNASDTGFDGEKGGFFDHGIPGGPVVGREKVWWAQFEALAGLWWTYRLTHDVVHLERLAATLDWIEGPARDPEYGEWYWGVMPDGSVGPRGDHKGELWKASYHTLRALMLTGDWITEWLC